MTRQTGIAPLWRRLTDMLALFPMPLILLMLRIGVALVFWKSGLTKVVTTESGNWPAMPLQVAASTFSLFESEYMVPLLPPVLAAWLAAITELSMSTLLVVGLASRFAAAALLGMTLVIQVFVYPGNWPDHLFWAGALAIVLTRGPGAISLDALIGRRLLD
jgi:putative oxidoreductase